MEYSGRTTDHSHKMGEAWKESKGAGTDCIQQRTVFDVQWSNCPVEVAKEVQRLWGDRELGNDRYYYSWDGTDEDGEHEDNDSSAYPIIHEYLLSRGVTKCMIVWWW